MFTGASTMRAGTTRRCGIWWLRRASERARFNNDRIKQSTDGRLPVRRAALRVAGETGAFERVLLPDVPEGVRPALHGPDRRRKEEPALDARHLVDLQEFQHGRARLLPRLRHAADLLLRQRRTHQRR